MTVADVDREIEGLRQLAHDAERAHAREDALRVLVLTAIADGRADDPVGIARAVLRTSEISFARWYA